jgi:hypothetical protein
MSKSRVETKGDLMMKQPLKSSMRLIAAVIFALLACASPQAHAQQKELPEVSMLTAVPNFAFAAIWVAEQLKYFEQEGVRVKITPAPSGSVCLNAVVGRSNVNEFEHGRGGASSFHEKFYDLFGGRPRARRADGAQLRESLEPCADGAFTSQAEFVYDRLA